MRFELTTLTLARLCSTPELRPLAFRLNDWRRHLMSQACGFCNLYCGGSAIRARKACSRLALPCACNNAPGVPVKRNAP